MAGATKGYLYGYTYGVAISNRCLINLKNGLGTFRCTDCRKDGPGRHGTMRLPAAEFIHRFLMHVHHSGNHPIPIGTAANRRASSSPISCLGASPTRAEADMPVSVFCCYLAVPFQLSAPTSMAIRISVSSGRPLNCLRPRDSIVKP